MFLDKGPIDWIRKGKGRKGKTFFTQGKNLVRGIDIKLGFSWTTLQDPLDQDKGRGILPFLMVGNLMWGNGDPFTFRYFQLNRENSPIVSKAQQIRNTLGSPRLYPNPFELWQMFFDLLPKVCLRGSQSNGSNSRFMRYVFQYAHKFDKIVYIKQGE